MSNINEILTDKMNELLSNSISLAVTSKNPQLEILHVLWALSADSSSVLNQILNKFGVSNEAVELAIKSEISRLPKSSNVNKDSVNLSFEILHSLELARGKMSQMGDKFIAVDTWLSANLKENPIKSILQNFCDLSEFEKELELIRGNSQILSQTADETNESLTKFGVHLTQ